MRYQNGGSDAADDQPHEFIEQNTTVRRNRCQYLQPSVLNRWVT